MDLKQIKELMAAMRRAGLKRISLKEKTGFEIELECFDSHPEIVQVPVPQGFREYHSPIAAQGSHSAPLPHSAPFSAQTQSAPAGGEEPGQFITAPMVGTYYDTPAPGKPPFVKVGDKVDPQTVVCVIEAMKVMNEVKAGVSGTVVSMLHTAAQPVEFGTKLFKIV